MTDLSRLKVSLTKHNAHKVSRLLKNYPANEVISHLDEVNAELAQARKNLSALPDDGLPPLWSKAKVLGADAIDALVFVAIVFSHHELIEAMAKASDRDGFSGRIVRGAQLAGKAYTNFVRVIDQLGFATKLEYEGVSFSLKSIFQLPGLGALVAELLELKLAEAQWDSANSLSQEVVRLKFHDVFGIAPKELADWLSVGAQPVAARPTLTAKDEEFFQGEAEGEPFVFKPGHAERDVEPIAKAGSAKGTANRLHNDIQNRLFKYLKDKLGPKHVGTENNTGSGTAIDVVTQYQGKTTFYEIKTGSTARACVRQALPQLLEYAFWPGEKRADELVIVSHLPATKDAVQYLDYLAREFGLPISYRQFDLDKDELL